MMYLSQKSVAIPCIVGKVGSLFGAGSGGIRAAAAVREKSAIAAEVLWSKLALRHGGASAWRSASS